MWKRTLLWKDNGRKYWFIWSEGNAQTMLQKLVCCQGEISLFMAVHVRGTGYTCGSTHFFKHPETFWMDQLKAIPLNSKNYMWEHGNNKLNSFALGVSKYVRVILSSGTTSWTDRPWNWSHVTQCITRGSLTQLRHNNYDNPPHTQESMQTPTTGKKKPGC